MRKNKKKYAPKVDVPLIPAPKSKETTLLDIFKSIARDSAWQSIGVLVSIIGIFVAIGIYIVSTYNFDKKIVPLSVPEGFVAYSNQDFAISFPYTLNQNNSAFTRSYTFDLGKTDKEAKMLSVIVIDGHQMEGIIENSEFIKQSLINIFIQPDESLLTTKVLSDQPDSFQGFTGTSTTLQLDVQEGKTQEIESTVVKIRIFFDTKTNKIYGLIYTTEPDVEQILSTLNLMK